MGLFWDQDGVFSCKKKVKLEESKKDVLADCLPSLHTDLVPALHLLRDVLRQLVSFHELHRRCFFLPSSFSALVFQGHTSIKKLVQVDVRLIVLVNQVLGSDVRV